MINCHWWQIATTIKCNFTWCHFCQVQYITWFTESKGAVTKADSVPWQGRTWPTDWFIQYMTILLEYLGYKISMARHSKDLEGSGLPLAIPLKRDMVFENFAKFRGMLLYNIFTMPTLCSKLAYYAGVMSIMPQIMPAQSAQTYWLLWY